MKRRRIVIERERRLHCVVHFNEIFLFEHKFKELFSFFNVLAALRNKEIFGGIVDVHANLVSLERGNGRETIIERVFGNVFLNFGFEPAAGKAHKRVAAKERIVPLGVVRGEHSRNGRGGRAVYGSEKIVQRLESLSVFVVDEQIRVEFFLTEIFLIFGVIALRSERFVSIHRIFVRRAPDYSVSFASVVFVVRRGNVLDEFYEFAPLRGENFAVDYAFIVQVVEHILIVHKARGAIGELNYKSVVADFTEIAYRGGDFSVYRRAVVVFFVAKVGQILYRVGVYPIYPVIRKPGHIDIVRNAVLDNHRIFKVFVYERVVAHFDGYARFVIKIVRDLV